MQRPGGQAPPAPKLIKSRPHGRTIFIFHTECSRPPEELWNLIVNGSDVVLIVEAPDEGFSAFGDRVVTWNAPDVTIDGVVYVWPEDSSDVRQLFEE
jgi:hypothetical protein